MLCWDSPGHLSFSGLVVAAGCVSSEHCVISCVDSCESFPSWPRLCLFSRSPHYACPEVIRVSAPSLSYSNSSSDRSLQNDSFITAPSSSSLSGPFPLYWVETHLKDRLLVMQSCISLSIFFSRIPADVLALIGTVLCRTTSMHR